MENINKIIDLAHQELDNYSLELASLLILEKADENSISTYELISARQRMSRLINAIDKIVDGED